MQAEQVNVAPAIQRQAGKFFLSDHIPKLCVDRIHLREGTGDFHGFRSGAHRQLEVCPVFLIDFERDAVLNRRLKSRSFSADRVVLSHWDSEELVSSRGIGLNATNQTCVQILQDHRRIGYGGAAGVNYCAQHAGCDFGIQELAAHDE